MSGAVVKFLRETYGKASLLDCIKAGGWKAAIDGSLAEATIFHGPAATHVGTDAQGNKYYERNTDQYGRHRWVVYADLDWRDGQDAASVPADWHGWLHNVTDANPASDPAAFAAPPYVLPHKGYVSWKGDAARYQPKGSWHCKTRRGWGKVEAWVPPQK